MEPRYSHFTNGKTAGGEQDGQKFLFVDARLHQEPCLPARTGCCEHTANHIPANTPDKHLEITLCF